MYILITNKDAIHEYKGIRELIYIILKMMNVENFWKKNKLQFILNQPSFFILLRIYH